MGQHIPNHIPALKAVRRQHHLNARNGAKRRDVLQTVVAHAERAVAEAAADAVQQHRQLGIGDVHLYLFYGAH
jgi:hypothetical protein